MLRKIMNFVFLIVSGFLGGAAAHALDTEALAISVTSVLFPTNANPGTGAMWTGVGTLN